MKRILVMIAVLLTFCLLRDERRGHPRTIRIREHRPGLGLFGCMAAILVLGACATLVPTARTLLEGFERRMMTMSTQDLTVIGLCFFAVIAVAIAGIVRLATQRKE